MIKTIEIPQHLDLFQRGLDAFGQSPLTFENSEVNKKAQTMYEADVPSNFIQDGDTIVRLNMIEGYLQSDGFVSGSEGWRIDSEGNVEFNNGTFRGTLSAASGTLGAITISAGGNIKMGKTSFVDTTSGFWIGDDSETPKFVIGNATQYMSYDGEDLYIIGGTFRTGSTQYQIRINGANGNLELMDYETVKASIHLDGARSMVLTSADNIYFFQQSGDQLATFTDGDLQLPSGGKITIGGNEGKVFAHDLITSVFYDDANNRLRARRRTYYFTGGICYSYSGETTFTVHDF
jgi:hypothetical protein